MMLRRTKTNNKKRHSMFIDIKHTMPLLSDVTHETTSKHVYQSKNKSMETLTRDEAPALVTSRKKKASIHTKLKRSSVLLDNSLVRDYNLAINHFENSESSFQGASFESSQSSYSISSNGSRVSSLFSSASTISIHSLIYDDLASEKEVKNEYNVLLDKPQAIITIGDTNRNYVKNDNVNEMSRLRMGDDYDDFDDIRVSYNRTNLDFE